ncbi:MAG TPA: hypothetical protein VK841_11385 [Polyangiaceae bacterium]|nr:hypothetical protein [Polyangiaceae bacterium]
MVASEFEFTHTHGGSHEREAEAEAVAHLTRVSNEAELEQFLPLLIGPLLTGLKTLAPVVLRAAVPILRSVAGSALGSLAGPPQGELEGEGFRRRKNAQRRQGEMEGEWGWHHRRWGGGWRGRPWRDAGFSPPPEGDGEAEGFLPFGKLLGGLLGESEGESEAESFLLGKLLGGLTGEIEGMDDDAARHTTARWFVRLARRAAREAASQVASRHRRGGDVSWPEVKRLVYDAVMRAGQSSESHHRHPHGHGQPWHPGHEHGGCSACAHQHSGANGHGHGGHPLGGFGEGDGESAESGEFEAPATGPAATPPRHVSLANARKELKACLKDMHALKGWADPGNATTRPFLDAFSSALANGRAAAPAYTAAMQGFAVPTHVTREQARKNLQDLLEDMDSLKEWADPSMPAWAPLAAAFSAVRGKALLAASVYASTLGRP